VCLCAFCGGFFFMARLRAVLIKKKAEETQALAA
jgi:hypothetical protein